MINRRQAIGSLASLALTPPLFNNNEAVASPVSLKELDERNEKISTLSLWQDCRKQKIENFRKWDRAFKFTEKLLTHWSPNRNFYIEASMVLENQRISNEVWGKANRPNAQSPGFASQFNRVSIPLLLRVLQAVDELPFLAIQSMAQPAYPIFFRKQNVLDVEFQCATTRKSAVCWQSEAAQDLKSVNGLDAEAELTAILAQELALEIQRLIVSRIRAEVPLEKVNSWAFAVGYEKNLLSNKGDFILTSPEIASFFEKTIGIQNDDIWHSSLGLYKKGMIDGKIPLIVDPLFPANEILIGKCASSPWDAPAIWSPYHIMLTPNNIVDPDTFYPRQGLMIRSSELFVDLESFARFHIC